VLSSHRVARSRWTRLGEKGTSSISCCVVLVCLLAFLAPLSLAAREIVIQQFNEHVVINPDGTRSLRQ
jgi:hypothetical protein